MIGMERNSDLVKMASYAPLFEHYDLAEWSPDLAGLDARPGKSDVLGAKSPKAE